MPRVKYDLPGVVAIRLILQTHNVVPEGVEQRNSLRLLRKDILEGIIVPLKPLLGVEGSKHVELRVVGLLVSEELSHSPIVLLEDSRVLLSELLHGIDICLKQRLCLICASAHLLDHVDGNRVDANDVDVFDEAVECSVEIRLPADRVAMESVLLEFLTELHLLFAEAVVVEPAMDQGQPLKAIWMPETSCCGPRVKATDDAVKEP